MNKLIAVAFTLVLVTVASVGARSLGAPVCVAHTHVTGVSDPNPADCMLCAGNPQAHVRVLWSIQKETARVFQLRLL